MTHVITDECVKCKYTDCVEVCPVDCFHEGDDMLVIGDDMQKLDYKLSVCCNPIPGDEVFGFVTINEGIKVHRKDCPNAISMQSNYAYRIIPAKWIDSSQEEFTAMLKQTLSWMLPMRLSHALMKISNIH